MIRINFEKENGLVPTIIQEFKKGEILMLGYMNKKSLEITLKTGYVHFWSRSRKKIWMKGEESGNKLKLVKIYTDCDADALLIEAELEGVCVCHTGNYSCFFNEL